MDTLQSLHPLPRLDFHRPRNHLYQADYHLKSAPLQEHQRDPHLKNVNKKQSKTEVNIRPITLHTYERRITQQNKYNTTNYNKHTETQFDLRI